jgi:hypothetical protein
MVIVFAPIYAFDDALLTVIRIQTVRQAYIRQQFECRMSVS